MCSERMRMRVKSNGSHRLCIDVADCHGLGKRGITADRNVNIYDSDVVIDGQREDSAL